MIEREFINEKMKQLKIKEAINSEFTKSAEIGGITMEKTPLGERIVISTTRPGIIIGRGGSTIKELTNKLKNKFRLENPQIETLEIPNPHTSAEVVAKKIAGELERFGPSRFKGIGYREMGKIMTAGAFGVEIVIDGPIPGARSRKWRFWKGYMKKCGFISDNLLDKAQADAVLKKGTVGVSVTIMHPDTPLPDKIIIVEPESEKTETIDLEEVVEEKPKEETKLAEKKAPVKKIEAKKETKSESTTEKPKKVIVKKEETNPVAKKAPTKKETTK
ncbi:MAG: 30S ribosomal protein S3 [uncultured DHVE6 group euryarchaeote]|nr:MAG: 30S ribosomal protein S3 [uncultured DHVE6 group euryarchaeote]